MFRAPSSDFADFRYSESRVKTNFRHSESHFWCYPFNVPKELAEVLRAAIRDSGQPLLAIATATGVGVATLSEFMSGADMRLKNASKIAAYLGLELVKSKPKRGGRSAG